MATVGTAAQVNADTLNLTWGRIWVECEELAQRWVGSGLRYIYGVPTGGSIVASHVARYFGLPMADTPDKDTLVIDDLVDSGDTLRPYVEAGHQCDALYRKPHSPPNIAPDATLVDGWVHFPWEHETKPESAITRVLEYVGEDPTREGLIKTPNRVLRMYNEMTEGYRQDPKEILGTVFTEPYDELVAVKDIPFYSLCEHHLLPIHGTVSVGYIPTGKVVGLSKIPRLVECFAKRLQVQERMTVEIANALQDVLEPLGVGVIIKARHLCMGMRGVKKEGVMNTSRLLGALRDDARARAEFLELVR